MYLLYDMYLIAGSAWGMVSHPSPLLYIIWRGKTKIFHICSYAIVFSYVCILNFVFQYDCMRKVVYLKLKIKWGKLNLCFHHKYYVTVLKLKATLKICRNKMHKMAPAVYICSRQTMLLWFSKSVFSVLWCYLVSWCWPLNSTKVDTHLINLGRQMKILVRWRKWWPTSFF